MSGSLRTHKLTGSEPAGQQETVAELKSTVAQQQKDFDYKLAKQQKQIEALTAGLQKVSAELELKKTAPQTVLNSLKPVNQPTQ